MHILHSLFLYKKTAQRAVRAKILYRHLRLRTKKNLITRANF